MTKSVITYPQNTAVFSGLVDALCQIERNEVRMRNTTAIATTIELQLIGLQEHISLWNEASVCNIVEMSSGSEVQYARVKSERRRAKVTTLESRRKLPVRFIFVGRDHKHKARLSCATTTSQKSRRRLSILVQQNPWQPEDHSGA